MRVRTFLAATGVATCLTGSPVEALTFVADWKLAFAIFIDPWGTRIALTENLAP